MTNNRIHEVFNVLGKLLKLNSIGDDYSAGAKALLLSTQQQWIAASGSVDPYRELTTFTAPLIRSAQQTVQALDRISIIAKSGVDNFVRAIGPELGQDQSAAPATILSALRSSMLTSSETVAPSGAFYSWFLDAYNVQLPQSNTPTIADALITTIIV